MSERILIAGCGDLGRRAAALLLARGAEVHALRRRPPARDGDGIRWLAGDLTQPATLRGLPRGITGVVYAPAPAARDEAAYRAVFVDGLRHLLGALDGAVLRRVLFVSSSAVYGGHGDAWVDEDTPPAPPGFNGAVLLAAERWLAAQPLPAVALRLAGLYGPGRLQLLDRLRRGEARVPRARPYWANRIQVDDAAAAVAHLLALERPAPVYVGADDTPLPLDALYDHLARLLGAPLPAEGPAPAGAGGKRLRNARLRASGWAPRWPDARAGYAALLGEVA
ncbi:NAD-dependent epimerase/dehydratase family protein [Fulvimonas soli]|jgi:nucleoside-diphosphate-sugar epimerase|uniref:Nucleoside-diphosphate-sugar epimerase n=1 Tax=Fulvimonas soli TaxID=155197 RepID=A0A316HVS0_9GAMM|nr:NAD-dependent epimerase/dehydratase family protein [Fulvimonas soli]PWK84720.1 nucleoside-diphosphate-sugar epimerase [Fulvimonas soli]TNY25863.1 NAD(P)-dependent oxidoreductase [Fulvimonas soli]